MVKFVSGPSVGAQKSYYNHRIAREGQFRIPRAYGSVKNEVNIKVRNYHYCGGSSYSGWQMPGWLQWLGFGMNFLQSLIPQRPTYTEQPQVQVQTNPLQSQLDELNDRIDELEAENKKLKEGKETEEPKKKSTPVNTNANVELATEEVIDTQTTPDTVEEKTVKVFNKTTRLNANQNEGYTWQSLQDAYVAEDGTTVPNTAAFRNWFRQTYLNGATDIGINEQHYPKTITYGGKTYSFDTSKYKPHTITTSSGYDGTSAHTQAVTETKKGTTTTTSTWKGVATATWKDKDGKEQKKTVTVSNQASKEAAIAKLKAEIKAQVPADANIKFGTKEQ